MQIYTAAESAQRLSSTATGSLLLVMIDLARSPDGISLVRDKLRPLLGNEAIEVLLSRQVLIQASNGFDLEEQKRHAQAIDALREISEAVPTVAVTGVKFTLGRVRRMIISRNGPDPVGLDLSGSGIDPSTVRTGCAI